MWVKVKPIPKDTTPVQDIIGYVVRSTTFKWKYRR